MDTLAAFAMMQAAKGKPLMVFDWHRAAQRIREVQPETAAAGLSGDWEYTGDEIYRDGKPLTDVHAYLTSTWAKPELEMDGEIEDCFVMQSDSPGWDADTIWPDSALAILSGKPPTEADA